MKIELHEFDLPITFQHFLTETEAINLEAHSISKRKSKMKRFDERITIRISNKILEQLTDAAEILHETKSAFIKRSISSYLAYHHQVELPLIQKRLAEKRDDNEN